MLEHGERTAHAFAKLNLGLHVCGRRSNGYHEVATILHEISLADRFVWTPTGGPFRYAGSDALAPDVDIVRTILDAAPDRDRWTGTLRLCKHIPMSAGLGGGSSDAALALRLAFPERTLTDLVELAAEYGSDVPFFVRGGTALATGTGTTLRQLRSGRYWFVVVVPPLEIANKT
ncbi:MAG: 4-(cytidine 5'-diphospho)-2-C-methyl-D-erythritol kinase, partial [Chloroflexi bacterium]